MEVLAYKVKQHTLVVRVTKSLTEEEEGGKGLSSFKFLHSKKKKEASERQSCGLFLSI